MSIGSAHPHRPAPPNQPDGTHQARRYNADQVIPLVLKSYGRLKLNARPDRIPFR
jgi:hypothetical protein